MTDPTLFDKSEPTVLGELERVVTSMFLSNEIGNEYNRVYNTAIWDVLREINRLKPTEIDKLKQASLPHATKPDVSASALSDKKLRQMAKKVCNGHQHAMRYNNMLNACFKMGKMILDELERKKDNS